MHVAILLLVACASNFLVWASPTAVMEPTAPAGVQQFPREESDHSLETTWVGNVHQPRELGKRWLTLLDRRTLMIVISEAVASSLGIASRYSFTFQYHYNSESNQLVHGYDPSRFSMRWPPPLVVGSFDNGRDLAVPAIVIGAASGVDSLVCTLIWGVRLRTDWISVVGMGLFELSVVTASGVNLRLDPLLYSWRFDPALS